MPDVAEQPIKRRRGMLGFYLGMGALLALAIGSSFAWTPLRVWYYKRCVASIDNEKCRTGLDGLIKVHLRRGMTRDQVGEAIRPLELTPVWDNAPGKWTASVDFPGGAGSMSREYYYFTFDANGLAAVTCKLIRPGGRSDPEYTFDIGK